MSTRTMYQVRSTSGSLLSALSSLPSRTSPAVTTEMGEVVVASSAPSFFCPEFSSLIYLPLIFLPVFCLSGLIRLPQFVCQIQSQEFHEDFGLNLTSEI